MQNNMTVHTINHVKNLKRIKIPRNIIKGWILSLPTMKPISYKDLRGKK